MTDVMTTKKPKEQKASPPFSVELIDQLLATVKNKDAEFILCESGLAGQFNKMLAERMLSAELTYPWLRKSKPAKTIATALHPKRYWYLVANYNWMCRATGCRASSLSW